MSKRFSRKRLYAHGDTTHDLTTVLTRIECSEHLVQVEFDLGLDENIQARRIELDADTTRDGIHGIKRRNNKWRAADWHAKKSIARMSSGKPSEVTPQDT
ncbi:hypothetical protein [Hydrogenophaga sp. NFH-34]|uniref:hypothetical protein n=1 Tax=Hydrogenophaga sp. NFH-34 TaxID=2744446 RepID=UPI001F2C32DE|nr:hypothetical protein [Hydrogenophaga sp. NFH-34]